jgi:L-rhamnose mutarotase
MSDNKWIQVDCRPLYACFRNYSFFYNDTKILIGDWSLNDGMKMYTYIIEHDNTDGWSHVNVNVIVT